MSRVRLLPASERRARRWKNGGGETREIASFPPAAAMDDFDWRLSMASVADPGLFSCFAGIDRVLAVVEGRLLLAFDSGAQAVELTAASPPHCFAGDVGVFGTPIGGEVFDLNLMTRRGRFTGSIERIWPCSSKAVQIGAPCAVILFRGEGFLHWRDQTLAMSPLDAALLEEAETQSVSLVSDSDCYIARLRA